MLAAPGKVLKLYTRLPFLIVQSTFRRSYCGLAHTVLKISLISGSASSILCDAFSCCDVVRALFKPESNALSALDCSNFALSCVGQFLRPHVFQHVCLRHCTRHVIVSEHSSLLTQFGVAQLFQLAKFQISLSTRLALP